MTYVVYALAWIGGITMARWARELWRTRKDKGYDSRKYGAF